MSERIIVDRLENGFAVCESGGDMTNIPCSQIDGNVHEGDILRINEHGLYTVDNTETQKRRDAISSRFERLKSMNTENR